MRECFACARTNHPHSGQRSLTVASLKYTHANRCVALSGLGVVIMLTQGGATRLVPACRDFAVPWAGMLLPLQGEISASNGRQAVRCLELGPNGRQTCNMSVYPPFQITTLPAGAFAAGCNDGKNATGCLFGSGPRAGRR